MARNSNSFATTVSLRLDDPDPRVAQIAQMLKNGIPIDSNNFCVIKGKDLLMYALKDFYKRWVEDKSTENSLTEIKEDIPIKKKRNYGAIESLAKQ